MVLVSSSGWNNIKSLNLVLHRYNIDMNNGLNTGMCALDFLLNGTLIKSLYICGFSFHGCKDKKYVSDNIVKSYETYLFDTKVVYKCNCPPTEPCKRRNDPRYAQMSSEIKQLNYFKNNIVGHPKAIIDNTIKNIINNI